MTTPTHHAVGVKTHPINPLTPTGPWTNEDIAEHLAAWEREELHRLAAVWDRMPEAERHSANGFAVSAMITGIIGRMCGPEARHAARITFAPYRQRH